MREQVRKQRSSQYWLLRLAAFILSGLPRQPENISYRKLAKKACRRRFRQAFIGKQQLGGVLSLLGRHSWEEDRLPSKSIYAGEGAHLNEETVFGGR